MWEKYLKAKPPGKGEKASVAYRIRLLLLDRWNLWPRLTKCQQWVGPNGERLNGTNNASERAIGWRVKERYRTMWGHKREESAVNGSRFLAGRGNPLRRGGANLAIALGERLKRKTETPKGDPASPPCCRFLNNHRALGSHQMPWKLSSPPKTRAAC